MRHGSQHAHRLGALLAAGLTIPQVFLVIGVLNAVVAFYIFMLVPEYLLRFVAFVVARIVYRFKVRGDDHIPAVGPAILVANHVSFIDPVLLMAASPRSGSCSSRLCRPAPSGSCSPAMAIPIPATV